MLPGKNGATLKRYLKLAAATNELKPFNRATDAPSGILDEVAEVPLRDDLGPLTYPIRIRWGKPRLALSVADPRGLRSVSALTLDGATHEKARGLYKAGLYVARIHAQGTFAIPANLGVGEADVRIRWGKPRLALGVADPRGLRSVSALTLDGATHEFLPGAGDRVLAAGVHAPLDLAVPGQARSVAFRFTLELAGSEAFAIAPLARQTAAAMRAGRSEKNGAQSAVTPSFV